MTNEEAIAVLDESKRQNEIMRDNPTTFWKISDMEAGIENAKKRILALDAAISAIRHVSAGQPLTLEQLRGMEGKPVWICRIEDKTGWWAIVRIGREKATTDYGGYFLLSDYGITWFAYDYPPAHINREAREPCECCRSAKFMNGKMMYKFCQSCGRPLTEEAWAELEKRVRGLWREVSDRQF